MSEIGVEVAEHGNSKVTLRVDLGQSLLSPNQYWLLAQKADARPAPHPLATLLDRFETEIRILADGHPVSLTAEDWRLDAVSLEAVENPLTPQMATISLAANIPLGSQLEIAVGENLAIPWPCLVRVDHPNFELPVSRLLTEDLRTTQPMDKTAMGSQRYIATDLALVFQDWLPVLTWVVVGFQHVIPQGLDHILFVLGLFFLSTRFSQLVMQISLFTVAHSITLACAIYGVVSVSPAIVEPLIAASIVYVAIDNLYSERFARWRMLVVMVFGLLHGLGFASALGALQFGPEVQLSSLLLFNVGVELGQVTVIVLAFVAVGWFRHLSSYGERIARPASITIAGVGTYWLVKRTLGLVA